MIYICIKKFVEEVVKGDLILDEKNPVYVMSPFKSSQDSIEEIFKNSFKGLFKKYSWQEVQTLFNKGIKFLYPTDMGYGYAHVELENPKFKYKFETVDDIIKEQSKFFSRSEMFMVYLNRLKREMEGYNGR